VPEHWLLRLRQGPRVTKRRFGSLEEALDGLAAALDEAGPQRLPTARAFVREVAPAEQVALRAELAGPQRLFPKVNGGVDLRGDGSAEPFLGRVTRLAVAVGEDESAVDALRRALTT